MPFTDQSGRKTHIKQEKQFLFYTIRTMARPKGTTKRASGMCGKCGKNPSVEGQGWCTACFTAYQYSRQNIIIEQAEGRGFARGVDAMVITLADEFARFPGVRVTCDEVAEKIRLAPRPSPDTGRNKITLTIDATR
jgi:hypothetical protein